MMTFLTKFLLPLDITYYQEAFRYIIYRVLRETENGLQEVSDNSRIIENKHILAYVSGFGFGIMAGAFSIVNILADTVKTYISNLDDYQIMKI